MDRARIEHNAKNLLTVDRQSRERSDAQKGTKPLEGDI